MAGPAPARRRPGRGLLAAALGALLLAAVLRGTVVEPFLVTSGAMAPGLLPGDVLVVSKVAYAVRLPFTAVPLLEIHPPRRGDVVVLRDPTDPARRLVKRVIGLPGETVELREQALHLDGVLQPRLELGSYDYLEPGGPDTPPRWDGCRRFREILDLGAPQPPPARPSEDPAAAWAAGAARVREGSATAHDGLQCRRPRAGRREGPFGPVRPGHLLVLGDNRDRSADGRDGWEVPAADVVGRGALVGWSWGPGGWWPGGAAGVRIDRLFKPVE